MKTILLTGCAGFIGQKTAEKLIDKGNKVIGIDNLNDYYDVTQLSHFKKMTTTDFTDDTD